MTEFYSTSIHRLQQTEIVQYVQCSMYVPRNSWNLFTFIFWMNSFELKSLMLHNDAFHIFTWHQIIVNYVKKMPYFSSFSLTLSHSFRYYCTKICAVIRDSVFSIVCEPKTYNKIPTTSKCACSIFRCDI